MLTDAQLRRIKANPNKKTPDKYSDTNGLQLHVFPTGRKTWIYAYRYQNKQRSLTLGSYPDLSLADARIKLSQAKKTLNEGIDPNQAKKSNLTQLNGEHSFEYVAMEWYRKKSRDLGTKHQCKNQSTFRGGYISVYRRNGYCQY